MFRSGVLDLQLTTPFHGRATSDSTESYILGHWSGRKRPQVLCTRFCGAASLCSTHLCSTFPLQAYHKAKIPGYPHPQISHIHRQLKKEEIQGWSTASWIPGYRREIPEIFFAHMTPNIPS